MRLEGTQSQSAPAVRSFPGFDASQSRAARIGFPPPVPLLKRVYDKLFALGALVFFAPFILAISIWILLREGGPVFFVQQRVGHGGRLFGCLKFRTMVRDADVQLERLLAQSPEAQAEWDASRKLSNDPRVSCVGRFLRRTSLDELPQFINVLRGEMSVVGPRPITPDEASEYREYFLDYKSVRPGITGLWQVSGRSDTTYAERVQLDVRYVANQSFVGDLKITAKTVISVLRQEGAR